MMKGDLLLKKEMNREEGEKNREGTGGENKEER